MPERMNKMDTIKATPKAPPKLTYDGERLFYNGTDISERCTDMTAVITGNGTKVTLVFENIDVDMKKAFKLR